MDTTVKKLRVLIQTLIEIEIIAVALLMIAIFSALQKMSKFKKA